MASPKARILLSLNLVYLVLSVAAATTTRGSGSAMAPGPAMPPGLAMPPSLSMHPHPRPMRRCPRNTLKLRACAKLMGNLVGAWGGKPPTSQCCSLLAGMVEMEAAACLCTTIRANMFGMKLNIPLALTLLLNVCGTTPPTDFICY